MSRHKITKVRPKAQKGNLDGKIAGSYDLEETIGKGHFAVVKLAKHVFTGEKVAVKVIDKLKLDDISRQHLFQEVICMKLVQHPNVVRLYEVIDTQSKLYLILEWGDGGDMYDYIMKHNGLDEETAKHYFKQIVQAIDYCHQLHVVHRDLKPENVVFFEKLGIVKLTDFGFSNKYTPGRKLQTSCGSLAYSAPEILLGDSYDAPAVDVWSLGVILYMLVCGEPPFQEANDSETLTMIMDCKYRLPPTISPECRDLISSMLVREPSQRATLQQIIDHPWLMFGEVASIPLRPLISREHLSEDDHAYIVQRMVSGEIARRDDVIRALEKNAYNHITATYYLLAEGLLRRQSERNLHHQKNDSNSKPTLAPLALSPRVKSSDVTGSSTSRGGTVESLVSPPDIRPRPANTSGAAISPTERSSLARRFSLIVEEEQLLEEDEEEEAGECRREQRTARQLCMPQATTEDSLSDDSDSRGSDYASHQASKRTGRPKHAPMRPLHSVRSSPQLLNQIHEEGESGGEEDDMLSNWMSPQHHSRGHHRVDRGTLPRRRLTPHSRGSSYSSSDTSDNDDLDITSKCSKDKLKHRFRRRDSSDHSSDTDGPSGHSLGGASSSGQELKTAERSSHQTSGGKEHSQNCRDKAGNTGRQNGTGSLLGKRDSATSPGSECTGQKISNSSPLSISGSTFNSVNSRSERYKPDLSPANSPTTSEQALRDIEALNIENKARSRIIHVRSKDFTDLVQRFKGSDSDAYHLKEPGTKFRRRPKQKLKTDINRNGLVAHADCSLSDNDTKDQASQQQNVAKTKCCNVI